MWRVDPKAGERKGLQPAAPPEPPLPASRKLAFPGAMALLGLVAFVVWDSGSAGLAVAAALVLVTAALAVYSFTGRRPRGGRLAWGVVLVFALLIAHVVLAT